MDDCGRLRSRTGLFLSTHHYVISLYVIGRTYGSQLLALTSMSSTLSHFRSRSRDISSPHISPHNSHHSPPPRSPSPPSQTFHPTIPTVPTPALLESVAGGAHYSGIRVDPEGLHKSRRRRSSVQYGPEDINSDHRQIMDDLKELYCCRPTREIFERSWRKDAIFEVLLV